MNRRDRAEGGDCEVLPRTQWLMDGAVVRIAPIPAVNQVIVEDEKGGKRPVRTGELRAINSTPSIAANRPSLANITEDAWDRARRLQADIETIRDDTAVAETTVD